MTTEKSAEDFLDIELSNFNGASDAVDQRHSYLRIGAEDANVTHGHDLAEKISSFIDDTRIRGGSDGSPAVTAPENNAFRTLTQAERQAETAVLRSKGGWRDHTDGNRITTTRGDKVEVIRGNYKLLVLGREQWRDDAGVGLNYESSGGITYHFDEVPGQVVDIRWEFEDAINTWRVIEECDKGHVVSRYHGVHKEWVQGGDVATRIGSPEAFAEEVGFTTGTPDTFVADDHFDKPADASHNASFAWPSADVLPHVTEETYCRDFYDKCVAKTVREELGSPNRWVDEFEDDQCVHFLFEQHRFNHYDATMSGDDAVEIWLGPVFFENFLGTNVAVKSLWFFDLRLGLTVTEINAIGIAEVNSAAAIIDIEVSKAKIDFVAAAVLTEADFSLLKVEKAPENEVDISGFRKTMSASLNIWS